MHQGRSKTNKLNISRQTLLGSQVLLCQQVHKRKTKCEQRKDSGRTLILHPDNNRYLELLTMVTPAELYTVFCSKFLKGDSCSCNNHHSIQRCPAS